MSEQTTTTKQAFNVTMNQTDLEQLLKIVYTLNEEIQFQFNDEGILIRTMDPSHVALIDIALPNNMFEKYEANDQGFFQVRIEEALKVVKQFDKTDRINMEIVMNDSKEQLVLSSRELEYTINTIESSKSDAPLPKISYDSLISLNNKDLIKYVTKVNIVSDYIGFDTVEYKTIITGVGDNSKCQIVLEKGMDVIKEITSKDHSIGTYSIEYLQPFLKAITSNPKITIEYSTQKPLRINVHLFNIGRVHYYLAPRVDN